MEFIALIVLIFVVLVLFYGIIAIHDIPYELAKKRNHPHSDVLHVAGWVSLFTLHAIWPFLWIWAMLYNEERGWGMGTPVDGQLTLRLDAIESRLAELETSQGE